MTKIRGTHRKGNKPSIQKALDAGDVQGVVDALTVRQKRFVEEYLVDFNATQAVVRAGYDTAHPNKIGSQLLAHPGVRAAIDQITLERADKSIIKPDYVLNKLKRTIEKAEADNNHAAVLRGLELVARHLGMFIERTEITGKDGGALEIEQRTKEEVASVLTALKSMSKKNLKVVGGTDYDPDA